jgi:hypothetical protein
MKRHIPELKIERRKAIIKRMMSIGITYTKDKAVHFVETAEKRCRILPAGGLGVSPSYKSPPRLGDIGG